MLPYLLLMAVFAAAAVLMPQRRPNPIAWAFAYIVLVLFVGLRHKVGMDWNNYLYMIQFAGTGTLMEAFGRAEPAYAALLWASGKAGLGIYAANLAVALILATGIFKYAKATPMPWLSLLTAIPILVVVVGMSANRQAAAIGILLWLCAGWQSAGVIQRFAVIALAASFHYSAIFFLAFAAFDLRVGLLTRVSLIVLLLSIMGYFFVATGVIDYYDEVYITGQTEAVRSDGALQHVLINAIPALLVFAGKSLRERLFPTTLHVQMAVLAMILVPVALAYSTVAGRMTLYLFPVSMAVVSGLPGLFSRSEAQAGVRTLLGLAQSAVLVVWLMFANSSFAYIPYSNALRMESWELHLCCN